MKILKSPPGAKRLIDSLRHLGYECAAAIADLVDNSISASATEIHVAINPQRGICPPSIVVADNGFGMRRAELDEAMRFGTIQTYSASDLGRFGLGLKTASLSQCRVLTVASMARGKDGQLGSQCFARWNLDQLVEGDDWDLQQPEPEDLDEWEREALSHMVTKDGGTAVLWTGIEEALPLLASHDVRQRERFLARLVVDVGRHLSMVFHRFMDGSMKARPILRLFLCGKQLPAWDPFCRSESTFTPGPLILPSRWPRPVAAGEPDAISVEPFILPREDEFSSPTAWRLASGPRNWNQQQGFYFYRRGRLLQAGGWSWLRSIDEHLKLLRIAVHIPLLSDRDFGINVTKMRARIPEAVRDAVRDAVSVWAKAARARYGQEVQRPNFEGGRTDNQPASGTAQINHDGPPTLSYGNLSFALSNSPGHSLVVSEGPRANEIRVIVPHRHFGAGLFNSFRDGVDGYRDRLALAALCLLEVTREGHVEASRIPFEPLRRAWTKLPS